MTRRYRVIKQQLTPTGRFGYSLVQAFKSSDQDPAYTALSQVTNAARRVPEGLDAAGFAVPVWLWRPRFSLRGSTPKATMISRRRIGSA
jgi:hypothetical protein